MVDRSFFWQLCFSKCRWNIIYNLSLQMKVMGLFQCVSNTDERVCGKRDDVLLLSHSEIWSDVWIRHVFAGVWPRTWRDARTHRLARARAHRYIKTPESSLSISPIGIYSSASLSTDTMEKLTLTHGFNSETNATRPWRPWIHKRRTNKVR